MDTPVNFELAKLLKEKGFDIVSINCYAEERFIDKNTGGDLFTGVFRLCAKSRFHKRYYYAPTITEVVMWLYEKHGIWINVSYKRHSEGKHFAYNIRQTNGIETYLWEYNTPTQAYEAAIEYCLEKII